MEKQDASESVSHMPSVGEQAPDFTTTNDRGDLVNLSDFLGHTVVLYFYPKAMTPGCTTQACGLRDAHDEYAKRGIVVLGVSPDPKEKLEKFKNKERLNFDLLSDADHKIAESYGVWVPKKLFGVSFMGMQRSTFLINPDGTIKDVLAKVNTKTHHQDVLRRLR